MSIFFCGDIHGSFAHITLAVQDHRPGAIVLLGDLQAPRPLEVELAEILDKTEVWLIHGNHDTDSEADHDHLFGSRLAGRNLHGRVETVAGVRIAGLGGVFRSKVWSPPGPAHFASREDFVARTGKGNRWRGGLPLKHRSTIFPADIDRLAQERAEVLVTHEAPSSHPHGFAAIDELARRLGAGRSFHGHHHDSLDYSSNWDALGVQARGVGFRGIMDLEGRVIRVGDYDDPGSGGQGTGPPIRLFGYAPSRGTAAAQILYAGVQEGSVLMTDGYVVYDAIAQTHRLVHLGCWAHCWRGFHEALQALPKRARGPEQLAARFLALIAQLYAVESRAREHRLTAQELLAQRQQHSAPVLGQTEALLLANVHAVLPGSLLGKALHYLSSQWSKLTLYVTQGTYPIDNNAAENSIRPFVLGRKNYLHFGSDAGGERAAVIYSLIGSCKLGGIDPQAYLHHVLGRIADHPINRIDELLPWRMAEQLRPAWQAAQEAQDMARAA